MLSWVGCDSDRDRGCDQDDGTGFRNITEAVDTTTAAGRMMLQMIGSFADGVERSMVRERTRAGLASARDRGARLGRPSKLNPHQQREVIRAVRGDSKSAADAGRLFGVHRSNITRLLARYPDPITMITNSRLLRRSNGLAYNFTKMGSNQRPQPVRRIARIVAAAIKDLLAN